jgi:FkbM family methyltransferase
MFELIDKVRLSDNSNSDFLLLRRYFDRFFDAQALAAANSSTISEDYRSGKYGSDREFSDYMNAIKNTNIQDMEKIMLDKLRLISISDPEYYKLITELSYGWYHENLILEGINGKNNSLVTNRAITLKNNIDKLEWIYENLSDAISRRSLNAILKFWLTFEKNDWLNIAVYSNDVVDTSVYPFYKGEVFVDCGSYIGDTVVQYVNTVNTDYSNVYTYDISSSSIELIKENLAPLPNINVRHKGTGDTNTEMSLFGVDEAFHGNKLVNSSSSNIIEKVSVVRLDDDIKEPISFLKIDCEGMDKETLRGAGKHIQKYHPKIHLDSYHKLADLVNVPILIHELDPSYTLYLRIPHFLDEQPRYPALAYMAV